MRDIGEYTRDQFLEEVLNWGGLDGAAEGSTRKVISEGEDSLTPKQRYVFKKYVLGQYVTKECRRCCIEIEWSDMMGAHLNGGFCSYCDWQMSKDD
jgi:hypothetical protein